MYDLTCTPQRMQEEFAEILRLLNSILSGTITVTSGDEFDPQNHVYGHYPILGYIAEHALNGLGQPMPRKQITKCSIDLDAFDVYRSTSTHGKEVKRHGT